MRKWEYLFVVVQRFQAPKIRWAVESISNPELQDWVKDGRGEEEASRDLGEQGWELVAYSLMGDLGSRAKIVFKRPKN